MAELQYEQVTIAMPKSVMAFLRAHMKNPEEYLRRVMLIAFHTHLENEEMKMFSEYDDMVRLYDLQPVFETFDIC